MKLSTTLKQLLSTKTESLSVDPELAVLDATVRFGSTGSLDHFHFHLREWDGGQPYTLHRVVRLRMLRYLPIENRADAGQLARMQSALVGLYETETLFDLVYLAAGIFDPPLGVVQCYGVAAVGASYDQAKTDAKRAEAALVGVMANFPQSRLEPLDGRRAGWIWDALQAMEHATVLVGHPDPRENPRGMGREGPGEHSRNDSSNGSKPAAQQNENLFRGMAALREEFIFLALASKVDRPALARMLAGLAGETSVWASLQQGTRNISFGLSAPLLTSHAFSQSGGQGYSEMAGQAQTQSSSEAEGTAHTEGTADTVGHATSHTVSHAVGVAHTTGVARSTGVSHGESVGQSHVEGQNWGQSHTEGQAHTEGFAHSEGQAQTTGHSQSIGSSESWGASEGQSWGQSLPAPVETMGEVDSASQGLAIGGHWGENEGWAETAGESASHAAQSGGGQSLDLHGTVGSTQQVGATLGGGVVPGDIHGSIGLNESLTAGGGRSWNWGETDTVGESAAHTQSGGVSQGGSLVANQAQGHSESVSVASPMGPTLNQGQTVGQTRGSAMSQSEGWSEAATRSQSDTWSQSDTASRSDTVSQGGSVADGVSQGQSRTQSEVTTVSEATTHSESWGESWGEINSRSQTRSAADTVSQSQSRGVAASQSVGTSIGRALTASRGLGFSGGLVPSISASKSYQWQNDQAILITRYMRQQQRLLDQAALEGAFLTDIYLLTRNHGGHEAGRALARQAFHGAEDVVTGVRAVDLPTEEQGLICRHSRCFSPSTREEPVARALSAYRDSTLLTMLQVAAYVAPGMFEEGAATTTQERIPAFAFYPDMPGEVLLGHQYSTETGLLTRAELRLDRERMMHTVFLGDTGYGKTTAAERMVVETTSRWETRTLVFDYGQGWRKLLNVGQLQGRVEIWQLFPNAARPLRWNPLQIAPRLAPERQLAATCDLFANAGGMGPKQIGLMRQTLEYLYQRFGVLTNDPEVWNGKWGKIRSYDELSAINDARTEYGLPERPPVWEKLKKLAPFERQALAVHRSAKVDVADWHRSLQGLQKKLNSEGARQSLEGILLRMGAFTGGGMVHMYGKAAPGNPTVAIEELGLLGPPNGRWGVAVLEGGVEMDEYAKVVLLSLIAWRLYADAVVRRRAQQIGPRVQIIFEEANKILGGAHTRAEERPGEGAAAALFETIFRDARKYDVWLTVIAQTISALAPAILSSCPNGFVGQLKNPRDRDLVMAWLGKSEKGFVDEDYKRFLSRMPREMFIARFGYSRDPRLQEPVVCRPLAVVAGEPTDAQIATSSVSGRVRTSHPVTVS